MMEKTHPSSSTGDIASLRVHFVISKFRDMKMQPSLERALRHKDIIGA